MTTLTQRTTIIPGLILDLSALALVYFTPALSHLIGLPLYLIEPMRIAIILAMAHTRKRNAYFLALTLPLFSFVVSAHPHILKVLLITAELVLNVWLFYFLAARIRANKGIALAASVVLSKGAYYFMKYILISAMLFESNLVSTPLWIQALTLSAFALYMGFMQRGSQLKS